MTKALAATTTAGAAKASAVSNRARAAENAIRAVYDLLQPLPDRASGTYHERRAARLLADAAQERFEDRGFGVSHQGFATDLSSGAMNIALHGALLALLAFLPLAIGALRVCSGEAEAAGSSAPLSWFTRSSILISAISAGLLFFARFLPGAIGWSLFSFFVPNLESGNVIVDDLPSVPRPRRRSKRHPEAPAGSGAYEVEALVWKQRFAKAKAEGRSRLVILAAHYDSARALPGLGYSDGGLLEAITKSGFALPTAAAYAAIALTLWFLVALSAIPAFVPPRWSIWLSVGLFAIGSLIAVFELVMASRSSILPCVQGYNDNLSGVAAAFATLEDLTAPKAAGSEAQAEGSKNSAFMLVLTGSEENGLHGSMAFARRSLPYALDVFGDEGVELWNYESVSGEFVQATHREVTFSGLVRSGDPAFALAYAKALAQAPGSVPNPKGKAKDPYFTGMVAVDGAAPIRVEVASEPVAACTDLTGFCAPWRMRRRLKIITMGALCYRSPDTEALAHSSESVGSNMPRDYHRLEDDYAAAIEPANLVSVVAAAILVADQVRR